ncbi:GlpM family protein [Vibrio metschnikovii]|uniref:GlpM family protein n=1 Tax=Vibrio metschnikovii TaxID=28172 RepID=A0A9X0R8Y8_VIBME|nr:GlpM family protein [Vibrio metschnikovii]
MLAIYYFSYHFSLLWTLSLSTLIWLAFAGVLIVSWSRFHPSMAV